MAMSFREFLQMAEELPGIGEAIIEKSRSSEGNASLLKKLADASTWTGAAGDASRGVSTRLGEKHENSASDNLKIAFGIKQVSTEASDVAKGIRSIVADANASENGEPSMDVDLDMNRLVIPQWVGGLNPKNSDDAKTLEKVEAKVRRLNQRIDTAKTATAMVDTDVANVINGGTGGKVTPRQIRDYKLNPDGKPEASGETKAADFFDKVPVAEQDVFEKNNKQGTQFGKDLKNPESPPIGGASGRFGQHTDVGSPKGPRVYKGGTGDHGTQVEHNVIGGKIPGLEGVNGRYDGTGDNLAVRGGSSIDVRKDGIVAEQHAGAYLTKNTDNAHIDLGPHGTLNAQVRGDIGIEQNANLTAVSEKGFSTGADAMAGIHEGQSLNYKGYGLDITGGVDGYAGVGYAGGLTFGETDDHKWIIGGSWGAAFGLGAKESFAIVVDPKEFGSSLGKLWNWVAN